MKNRKAKIVCALLISVMTLCACAVNTETSIEDEVARNLREVVQEDNSDEVEPESALEYVEVEKPDESAMTDDKLDIVKMEVSSEDGQGNDESTHAIEEEDVDLQIVFLGDSIFDSVRDETGIAKMVGEKLDADVYNLAIGGTTAGLRSDKLTDKEQWTEPSLLGLIYSMDGQVNSSILSGYKAGEVFSTCNFSETDYFIIEYGTNDFLNYIPLGTADYKGQYYFYFRSSLDMAISQLKQDYPSATIILCTPYYEEYWSADKTRYIGDCHSVNNGFGTLLDYMSVMQDVAKDYNLNCLNMYNLLGVSIYNVNDMTVDGIHPSEQTRTLYSELLAQAIQEIEETGSTTLDFQAQMAAKEAAEAANATNATESTNNTTATSNATNSDKAENSANNN